jgi:hypothetical protein
MSRACFQVTFFVTQDQRRGNIARNQSPAGLNKTIGTADSSKGIVKEIQVTLVALVALVDDLTTQQISSHHTNHQTIRVLTIALIFLPVGPVTSMQLPQTPALSQLGPEKAVP